MNVAKSNPLRKIRGCYGDQFYYKIERIRESNALLISTHILYPEQYINANYPNLEYYSSIHNRFKLDYHNHMNDEHFEEINEIVFPTPEHAAYPRNRRSNSQLFSKTKTTKLESTGQVLEYIETYKRSDFYKIKFISCDRDH